MPKSWSRRFDRSSPVYLLKNQQPAAFLPWGVKRLLFSRSQLSPSRRKQRVRAGRSTDVALRVDDGLRFDGSRWPQAACNPGDRARRHRHGLGDMGLLCHRAMDARRPRPRAGRKHCPQVSGQIIELRVGDNQYVHKGDVLYVIDPFDFEVALQEDRAQLRQKAADLQVKQAQSSGDSGSRISPPPLRNSKPSPAPRCKRKPRSKQRSNRWRRQRSICAESRFAAQSMATSRTS